MNTKIFFAVAFNAVLILAAASSDNGRPYEPVDILQSGNEVVPGIRSELECAQCRGEEACTDRNGDRLSDDFIANNIGCGSCNAHDACKNLGADATIGSNSCNGDGSCMGAEGESILNRSLNFG